MKEFFNFKDIGKKIKNFAKWSCWVEIVLVWIAAVIYLIIVISDDGTADLFWIPLVSGIFGPFVIWIGYLTLYAFGDLVDNITYLRKQFCPNIVEEDDEETETNGTESEVADVKIKQKFVCTNCSGDVFYGETECKNCGQKFDWNKL